MKKLPLRVSYNLSKLNSQNKGKIIAAVNATFLSEVILNLHTKDLSEKFIFWPDGILSILITRNFYKIPGRDILNDLIDDCKNNNRKICFIGDALPLQNKFLLQFKWTNKIIPYGTVDEIEKEITNIDEKIIVLNIPSPKQDLLAIRLIKRFPQANIYCTGGALNMLMGNENIVPTFLNRVGLEWLWRLRTDTKRRLIRLSNILINLPYGITKFKRNFYYEKA